MIYDINGNELATVSPSDFALLAENGGAATLQWEQGGINTSTGADVSASSMVRTIRFYREDSLRYLFVKCPSGYKYRLAVYNAETSSPTFSRITDYSTEAQMFSKSSAYEIYRFVLAKTDGSSLSPSGVPSGFSVVPVFLPVWASTAVGKSINAYTTARSNPDRVSEILSVANTYYSHRNDTLNGQRVMVYGQSTIFDNNTYVNTIDCSTFVGLCLRGVEFNDTPYHTGVGAPTDSYKANPSYTWSIDPFDYSVADAPTARVRTAANMAKWMIAQRRQVVPDAKLANVEAGDIVFYARTNSDGTQANPHRFLFINHVAIIISKRRVTEYSASATYAIGDLVQYNSALYEAKAAISTAEAWTSSHWTKLYDFWDVSAVPYYHEMLECTLKTPTINKTFLENSWESPSTISSNNFNTLCLVCRPDLGGL